MATVRLIPFPGDLTILQTAASIGTCIRIARVRVAAELGGGFCRKGADWGGKGSAGEELLEVGTVLTLNRACMPTLVDPKDLIRPFSLQAILGITSQWMNNCLYFALCYPCPSTYKPIFRSTFKRFLTMRTLPISPHRLDHL